MACSALELPFPDSASAKPKPDPKPDRISGAVLASLRPHELEAPPDAMSAIRALERSRRGANPHRGRTVAELCTLYEPIIARERSRIEAARQPLEDTTELRETFRESGAYHWPDRGAMLRAARSLPALRNHRLQVCMRRHARDAKRGANGAPLVEVVEPADAGTPRYRGLMLCESAWLCPTCAPRITESRRRELAEASQRWRGQGGAVLLFTFTFSHGPYDEIRGESGAWDRLGRALQRFAQSAVCKRFRAAMDWAGRVRAREVTFGVNGWHPHAHTLEYVTEDACTPEALAEWLPELKSQWSKCCAAVGLEASHTHGFDASLTDADDYIAKWGSAAELTKWHMKRGKLELEAEGEGRLHGLSPFDLLRIRAGVLVADPRLKLSKERAGELYAHYAEATKGTAQLHWTRGLKAILIPEPETDELKPDDVVLGELDAELWRGIGRAGREVEFLGLVESHGFALAEKIARTWAAEWHAYDSMRIRAEFRARGLANMLKGGP